MIDHSFYVKLSFMKESSGDVTPYILIENMAVNKHKNFIDKKYVEFSYQKNSMEGLRNALHKLCELSDIFGIPVPDVKYIYENNYYSKEVVEKAWSDVSFVLNMD